MAIVSTSWRARAVRGACAALLAASLGACAGAGGPSGTAASAPPPPADYLTTTDQYAALTRAAVSADYPAFARHIGAEDPAPVVAFLSQNFGGAPFDAYTREAVDGDIAHQRLVELRTTQGRLYLFLAMEKAPNGWNLSGYELTRDRAAAEARMGAAPAAATPSG